MTIVNIITSVKNLIIAIPKFSMARYSFYPHGAQAMFDSIKTEKIFNKLGVHNEMEITKASCFYAPYKFTSETYNQSSILLNMSEMTTDVTHFLLCLWFIKDHSAVLRNCYGILVAEEHVYFMDFDHWTSLADGTFKLITFDESELKSAYQFKHDLEKNVLDRDPIEETRSNNKVMGFDYSGINEHYRYFGRIRRALTFLHKARGEGHLPAKISSYVGVLECLFTTDKDEVSHKVTERCTLVLGGSFEEKKGNFKLIKEAYNIRSKFVHGAAMKDGKKFISHEYLVTLSIAVDNLMRTLLKIVVLEKYERFDNNDTLEEWFKELLLGG